jgi:hypothetical protein
MKLNTIVLLILSILLLCGTGCTDTGKYAVSAKAGTLGFGPELTTAATSNLNARVGFNRLDLDFDDREIDDIEYDFGLDFKSFSALADWYVFDGSFRISSGVVVMNHDLDLDARPTTTEQIGDTSYEPEEIGTLSGNVGVNDVAPYVGIGWGNPLTASGRWGFICDFGVAFTNSPDVKLSSNGTLASNPEFQENLEKERKEIEDDWDSFKIYPVFALSFYYRF